MRIQVWTRKKCINRIDATGHSTDISREEFVRASCVREPIAIAATNQRSCNKALKSNVALLPSDTVGSPDLPIV
jgi:hypothetical protein